MVNKTGWVTLLAMMFVITSSAGQAKDILFRPLLNKELRRLKVQQPGCLQKLAARTNRLKQEVFIDMARLYWGPVEDMTGQGLAEFEDNDREPLNRIALDLRADLKAFARQFGFKLCWQKLGNNNHERPDMTQRFLEYWDKPEDMDLITVSTQETQQ